MLTLRMQRNFEIWTNNIDFIGDFYPGNINIRGEKIGSQTNLVITVLKWINFVIDFILIPLSSHKKKI